MHGRTRQRHIELAAGVEGFGDPGQDFPKLVRREAAQEELCPVDAGLASQGDWGLDFGAVIDLDEVFLEGQGEALQALFAADAFNGGIQQVGKRFADVILGQQPCHPFSVALKGWDPASDGHRQFLQSVCHGWACVAHSLLTGLYGQGRL